MNIENIIEDKSNIKTKILSDDSFKVKFQLNRPTINGRIYPKEEMQKCVERLGYCVCSSSIDNLNSLKDASGVVTKAEIKDDDLVIECKLLKTKNGEKTANLLKNGEINVSPCFYGVIDDDKKVRNIIMNGIIIKDKNRKMGIYN